VPLDARLTRSHRFTANPYETAVGLCEVWVGDRLHDRFACLQRFQLPKQFVPRAEAKVAGLHRRAALGLVFRHVCLHLGKTKAATKWHARLQQMEKENFRSGDALLIPVWKHGSSVVVHMQV
jgi:hypothetical protein